MSEVKVCAKCGQEISGQVLCADGAHFHPDCFTCDGCNEKLTGPFHKKDGKRICEGCMPKVVCEACKLPITGAALKVGGQTYHAECFVCQGCSGSLSSGFFKVDGKNMCKTCADAGEAAATKLRRTCRKCKLPIDGKIILGDKDDCFHEACFTCDECACELQTFRVDPSRKYKFQEARYLCEPCGKKADEAEAIADGKIKTCLVCKEACNASGEDVLHLLDGYSLHWSCFKCKECGNVEKPNGDSTKMRLLRTKVDNLRKGKYVCDTCFEAAKTNLPAQQEIKVELRMPHGTYLGKETDASKGTQVAYSVKLMANFKCWLDCTTSTPISSGSWHAEGTYVEDKESGDEVAVLRFTVDKIPFGVGPEVGRTFEFRVEKGETNSVLICEGVRCPLQIGVPDFELQQMMKPPERQAAPKPVPKPVADPSTTGNGSDAGILVESDVPKLSAGAAGVMERTAIDRSHDIIKDEAKEVAPASAIPTAVPDGCLSYEDLRDANTWKVRGVDASSREQYLSDDAFVAVFGMSKNDFNKLAKWKRDKLKKDHGLF